ncbi:gonadotropin-releasing hormone receptor-like isoform X1 [Haliotis cracherodii]|uniref:gonadotropin-releasing hormone receptor-like isoform X1 n=1 Tax=Haliotis cracherodii TaxID=6455 RepID=UPI0039EC9824
MNEDPASADNNGAMDGVNASYLYLLQHEVNMAAMTTRVLRDNGSTDPGSDNITQLIMTTVATAPTFDEVSMTKTIVYWAMFVMSLVGNVATLIQMYRMRRRKSTINTLIVNLAIADLFVTFFCIAGEAVWAATVQWYAGNVMCKFVKYMQVFGLYLSTYITVAIGLDRCVAILDPMRRNGATVRVRVMILLAWIFSALFSVPQAIIFNVKKGPFVEDFYQCVTFGSYAGEWQSQLYTVASLLLMFVIPLVTIGTAYGLIFCTISRKSKEFTVLDGISCLAKRRRCADQWQTYQGIMCMSGCTGSKESITSSLSNEFSRGPVRSNLLRKAKRKSLRMSIVIVLAFVVCWSPYYVLFICSTFFWEEFNPRTNLWLFFIGMTNSLLNPMIYGAFQLCKVNTASSWRRGGSPNSSLKLNGNLGKSSIRDTPVSLNTNPTYNTHQVGSTRGLIFTSRCSRCGRCSNSSNNNHRLRYKGHCENGVCRHKRDNGKNRRFTTGDVRYCCFSNTY